MRSMALRFSKLLLLSAAFSMLPLNLWGQIKVLTDDPVANQSIDFVLLETPDNNSVNWSFQAASGQEGVNAPQAFAGQQVAKTVFPDAGKFTIVAAFQAASVPKTVTADVEISPATDSGGLEQIVLNAGPKVNPSKLGMTEFVLKQLLSNETQVDERDQRFLESCSAIAQIFSDQADKAPSHKLDALQEGTPARKQVEDFMTETGNLITSKLKELHPEWEVYLQNNGRRSPGQRAWRNFMVNFANEMTKKIDITKGANPDQNYINAFTFEEAWKELAAGFEIAAQKKEAFIEDYNKNRQILDAYNRNYGGSDAGGSGYRGPRCPLLIRLGLF